MFGKTLLIVVVGSVIVVALLRSVIIVALLIGGMVSRLIRKEHLILGTDERDLEQHKNRWLSENPGVRIIQESVRQEPPTLLTRIGGKEVPRFSMLLHYDETDLQAKDGPSGTTPPTEESHGEKHANSSDSQSSA